MDALERITRANEQHARWQIAFAYVNGMEDMNHELATTDHSKCIDLESMAVPFAEWFQLNDEFDLSSLFRAFRAFKSERGSKNG